MSRPPLAPARLRPRFSTAHGIRTWAETWVILVIAVALTSSCQQPDCAEDSPPPPMSYRVQDLDPIKDVQLLAGTAELTGPSLTLDLVFEDGTVARVEYALE